MRIGNGSKADKFPGSRASGIRFSGDRMIVLLAGGRELSVPLAGYPTLRDASMPDRKNWELIGGGRSLRWESLDLDLSVDGLLYGLPERIPRPQTARVAGRPSTPSARLGNSKSRRAGEDTATVTIKTETVEGTIHSTVSYHYDIAKDVLYVRLVSDRLTPALGEENENGLLEFRAEGSGRLIGITVVSWWKRFGDGSLPDSINEIEDRIGPWADRLNSLSLEN